MDDYLRYIWNIATISFSASVASGYILYNNLLQVDWCQVWQRRCHIILRSLHYNIPYMSLIFLMSHDTIRSNLYFIMVYSLYSVYKNFFSHTTAVAIFCNMYYDIFITNHDCMSVVCSFLCEKLRTALLIS